MRQKLHLAKRPFRIRSRQCEFRNYVDKTRWYWKWSNLVNVVCERPLIVKSTRTSRSPTGPNQPICQILFYKTNPMQDFVKWTLALANRQCLRTHDNYIPNSLYPKSISQSQIENLVKCMKIIAFCRKHGWAMQNHGLGINRNKIWADSSTTKIP